MVEREILIPEMDDIPERYRLRTDGAAFEIDIRESAAPSADTWPADYRSSYLPEEENPDQGALWDELVLPTDESDEFGYEGAFRRTGSADGWVTFRGELPSLTDHSDAGERCRLTAFCGTVEFTFRKLSHYQEIEDAGPEPQRLFVMVGFRSDLSLNGAVMDVRVTPELGRWVGDAVQRDHEDELDEITDAMRVPLERTTPGYERDQEGGTYRAAAEFREPNLLFMQTPGSATALTPENLRTGQEGYELVPSNCDSIAQQLAFVWGLAKLEEVSRRPDNGV